MRLLNERKPSYFERSKRVRTRERERGEERRKERDDRERERERSTLDTKKSRKLSAYHRTLLPLCLKFFRIFSYRSIWKSFFLFELFFSKRKAEIISLWFYGRIFFWLKIKIWKSIWICLLRNILESRSLESRSRKIYLWIGSKLLISF